MAISSKQINPVVLENHILQVAGAIRYNSGVFEGWDGTQWLILSSQAYLDPGTVTGSLLRWDGVDTWEEAAYLQISNSVAHAILSTAAGGDIRLTPHTTGKIIVGGTTPTIESTSTLDINSVSDITLATTGLLSKVVIDSSAPLIEGLTTLKIASNSTFDLELEAGSGNINLKNSPYIIQTDINNDLHTRATGTGKLVFTTGGSGDFRFLNGSGIVNIVADELGGVINLKATTNIVKIGGIGSQGVLQLGDINFSGTAAEGMIKYDGTGFYGFDGAFWVQLFVPNGTVTGSLLRWNGTGWVEETYLLLSNSGSIAILSTAAASAGNIRLAPDTTGIVEISGTTPEIASVTGSPLIISCDTGNLRFEATATGIYDFLFNTIDTSILRAIGATNTNLRLVPNGAGIVEISGTTPEIASVTGSPLIISCDNGNLRFEATATGIYEFRYNGIDTSILRAIGAANTNLRLVPSGNGIVEISGTAPEIASVTGSPLIISCDTGNLRFEATVTGIYDFLFNTIDTSILRAIGATNTNLRLVPSGIGVVEISGTTPTVRSVIGTGLTIIADTGILRFESSIGQYDFEDDGTAAKLFTNGSTNADMELHPAGTGLVRIFGSAPTVIGNTSLLVQTTAGDLTLNASTGLYRFQAVTNIAEFESVGTSPTGFVFTTHGASTTLFNNTDVGERPIVVIGGTGFEGVLQLGNTDFTGTNVEGMIKYDGTNFYGFDGTVWRIFDGVFVNAGTVQGSIPTWDTGTSSYVENTAMIMDFTAFPNTIRFPNTTGMYYGWTTVNNTTTLGDTVYVLIDALTNGPYTITLPTPSQDGQIYSFKDDGGATPSVQVTINAGVNTIDDVGSTVIIDTAYESVKLMWNVANLTWYVVL